LDQLGETLALNRENLSGSRALGRHTVFIRDEERVGTEDAAASEPLEHDCRIVVHDCRQLNLSALYNTHALLDLANVVVVNAGLEPVELHGESQGLNHLIRAVTQIGDIAQGCHQEDLELIVVPRNILH